MKILQIFKTLSLITVLSLSVCLVSCSNDDDPKDKFKLSEEGLTFNNQAGTQSVTVTSPAEWTPSSTDEWITPRRDGNQLSVTVTANDTDNYRTGEVSVSNGSETKILKVLQTANINTDLSISFRWKDAEEQTVPIFIEGEWTPQVTDKTWLLARRDGNNLIVSAADNFTNKERKTEISIKGTTAEMTIPVSQRSQTEFILYEHQTGGLMTSHVSPNGRYVIGQIVTKGAWLWDLKTNEFTNFGDQYTAWAVTDDGVVVGDMYYKGGAWHDINLTGINTNTAAIRGTTPDGSVMVGGAFNVDGRIYTPVVWPNGPDQAPITLENPTVDLLGEEPAQGAVVHLVSPDGTFFAGVHTSRTNGFQDVFCVWKPSFDWPGKEDMDIIDIGGKLNMRNFNYISPGCMSPNGEWITGYNTQTIITNTGDKIPFRYNTRTGTIEYLDQAYTDVGVSVPATDNNGTLFFSSPYGRDHATTEAFVWEIGTRAPIKFSDWLIREHNINLGIDNLQVCGISDDGKIMVGQVKISNEEYSAFAIEFKE